MGYIPVRVFGEIEYINTDKIVKVASYTYNGKEYAKIILSNGPIQLMTSELVSDVMKRLRNPEQFEYLAEEIENADENNSEYGQNQIGFHKA